ncbi:hypothetical protein ACFWN1_05895 [Streptomyces sp. NPDC058459]|uniref:DUF7620 family protein n=1 Tax=Streptomyces sp. NPDC058459 TaxID=3346508 RepID=UPI003667F5BB
MRWIRRLLGHRHERARPAESEGQRAATAALARAHAARQVAADRRPAVDEVAADLRAIRERNHFADLIRTTVLGGEAQ